jgi:uncharacterized protein (DUF305 family)
MEHNHANRHNPPSNFSKDNDRHNYGSHTANMHSPYKKLVLMTVISFIAMYVLMYSMVDSFANVIHNINQVYMAGLMAASMIVIEMVVMRGMYMNRKLNVLLISAGILLLLLCFFFIRKQTAVSDRQFLKSMIPHHAAAILMVRETPLHDPEVRRLAEDIISAQQKEIDFMKAKLQEFAGN